MLTPSPPQAEQGVLVMNWPRIVCCVRRTWPVPWQTEQVGGCWPSRSWPAHAGLPARREWTATASAPI